VGAGPGVRLDVDHEVDDGAVDIDGDDEDDDRKGEDEEAEEAGAGGVVGFEEAGEFAAVGVEAVYDEDCSRFQSVLGNLAAAAVRYR